MTFEEALNTVDAKIEYLGGLVTIVPYIPFTVDEIKEKLSKGVHDYNLDEDGRWIIAAGFEYNYGVLYDENEDSYKPVNNKENTIWELYAEKNITSIQMKESVAIVKQAARKYAALSVEERTKMQDKIKKRYGL